MSEETVQDASPEVIAPEQEQASVPEAETPPVESPPAKAEEKPSHWKAVRAQLELKEREKRLAQQENELLRKELELIRNQAPKAKEPEEDLSDLTENERRLHKQIKALEQNLEKMSSSYKVKDSEMVEVRLKAVLKDYDDVLTPENVEYLQTNHAPLAKALAALKDDPYEQGLAAYDAIKNAPWFQNRGTMQDKAKLEENSKKPLSVQAVRKQGVLSEANQFAIGSKEYKSALYKEMQEARKRA